MKNNDQTFLGQEKLGRLMGKYSVPCVISLLVAALYNIVDQIFIANAAYLGSDGNAANTVVFPLTVIALAIAVMIGDGCCAFVSISLGADRREDAHRGVGNAVVLSAAGGIVLCILYLIFSDEFIAMFGGTVNEKTFAFAKEYFFWIALGIPVYVFGQAMNPVIRSDGSPRFAMVSTVAGAVVNIGLNLLLIPRAGVLGASFATLVSYLVSFGIRAVDIRRLVEIDLRILPTAVSFLLMMAQGALLMRSSEHVFLIQLGMFLLMLLVNLRAVVRLVFGVLGQLRSLYQS